METKLRVYKKTVSIVNETACDMYQSLVGSQTGFLMESYDKEYDRFTFFGGNPMAVIRGEKDRLVLNFRDGSREVRRGNPRELLKELYSEFQVDRESDELAFSGGLVGNLGYDYIRYTEDLPDSNPDEIGIETICMMLVTEFVIVDHVAETMTGIVLDTPDEAGRQRAMAKAEELVTKARAVPDIPVQHTFVRDGRVIRETDTCESYSKKVEKIRQYIVDGHVFQTVLSQRWTVETGQSGFALYQELRELNPSPYLYYFNYGDFEVIGSSPEMIVKRQNGRIYTCPIAGTRPRGKTPEEDRILTEELLNDEKETAEHIMLVDLARNDMGRVSEFGTVKVTRLKEVQYYSHVMHIVSLVEGRSRKEVHPCDLISSFLPAGTLSGAPKIRAMEIIDELENVRRGLYGGATGYIDFSGDMDFCITIRTMIKKGSRVYLQAGAGIVADSVPENEYNECRNKAMALAKTLLP
ncbi:MAG: anthranilate synthase component I [Lachnospiraceae bacterium]|jgi:anthranilate synthase component 1|uniref:anthranilate synthase component I n=1 Tax=Clostridium sp. (strain SY8519) TaxID=1042156 RepID=UPI0002171CA1|nr:anthranilate synthase component I [Clostridium sp. SY8519]MCI1654591.1 anthranilate synthase component I [Lachnospiraceae bacterium]MCI1656922.1 anthranilate synthase component I [Lachnospiraceae bacterium]MCI2195402.1 anthranilate synthase component I [Lachnospiraceae bacterium]BAK48169.1 anthranilate/para-aminobenzoate synthase component I [Clostridium sp. SY8519]